MPRLLFRRGVGPGAILTFPKVIGMIHNDASLSSMTESYGTAPSESTHRRRAATPRRSVRGGRVTIAQIAEESGLSAATVSKVLNGRPDVSARTRTLVQELIVSRGYRKRHGER